MWCITLFFHSYRAAQKGLLDIIFLTLIHTILLEFFLNWLFRLAIPLLALLMMLRLLAMRNFFLI